MLGQIEIRGLAAIPATVAASVATYTPLLLALTSTGPVRYAAVEVPPLLRDLEVASGCAADYDSWLTDATA